MPHSHQDHPEIWVRPSPRLPLQVLSALIESRIITATPRLGVRDGNHPKGYRPGDTVTLRVLDAEGAVQLSLPVRIEAVIIRPLRQLTPDDLQNTYPYQSWEEVQRDLSFFEKRPIGDCEKASVIEFSYF